MKEIRDKFDFMKIENVYTVKGYVKKIGRQITDLEKIFAKDTSKKDYI